MSAPASPPHAGVIGRAARRFHALRRQAWHHALDRVPEGCILPRWALAVRWLLFPVDSAYWSTGRSRGYDVYSDTWLIEGMRFTGRAMHAIANASGETFVVRRCGEVVTLERADATVPRDGAALMAVERRRQIEAEGWLPAHDDEHTDGAMAAAAACYATFASLSDIRRNSPGTRERMLEDWPWEPEWWKPSDRVRDLVKAGALIAAEIDRLQRAARAEVPRG